MQRSRPYLRAASGRLALLDVLRGMTILWITLFHFYIDTRGAAGVGARPGRFVAALGRGDLAEAAMVAVRALTGLPSFRLDVFLFVSGLVLCLGRPLPAPVFYRRRAHAILATGSAFVQRTGQQHQLAQRRRARV